MDFLALAELRNVTRATALRNLSQAALSRRIALLENGFGKVLVVRHRQPVRLAQCRSAMARAAVEPLPDARVGRRGNQFDAMRQIRPAMPNVLERSDFRRIPGG